LAGGLQTAGRASDPRSGHTQLFGLAFYTIGVVLLLAFSVQICVAVGHYIDGVFFFALCMLLSVMMVYKVSLLVLTPQFLTLTCGLYFGVCLRSTGTVSFP
jgi:hypothetical protein